jgi:hypothetical protein
LRLLEEANNDKREEVEAEYFQTVTEWNTTFWMNRNKIRLLVGEAQAKRFLDYQDDIHPTTPFSIHYRLKETHEYVLGVKEGRTTAKQAQTKIDALNYACTDFLENLTADFLKRTASLQLLKPPEESTRQKRNLPEDRGKTNAT